MIPLVELSPQAQIYSIEESDRLIHPNAVFLYEDPIDPRFVIASFGHVLRMSPQGALPFENGSSIRTSPFRVEDGRLGKPISAVSGEDLINLKKMLNIDPETGLNLLGRTELEMDFDAQFEHDLGLYATEYHRQRENDIAKAYDDAEQSAKSIRLDLPNSIELLFSVDPLPIATESPLFDQIYQLESSEVQAYAAIWNLVRRQYYIDQVNHLRESSAVVPPRIVVHFRSKQHSAWCLGVEVRDPLALVDDNSEIAHFHRVTTDAAKAKATGEILAHALESQFDLGYTPQVLIDNQSAE